MAEEYTFIKRIAELAVVLGGIFAAYQIGYTTGKDNGEKELSVYKETQKFDLPALTKEATATIQKLGTATEEFSTLLVNNRTYQAVKDALAKAEVDISKLSNDLKIKSDENAQLARSFSEAQARVNDLTPRGELVSLAIGKGREIGNVVTIAYTQFYSTFGEIIANGSSYNAKPGAVIDIPLGYQKSCTIRVLEMSDSVINTRISCDGI